MKTQNQHDPKVLHERIAYLEENRRFIQNALEMALSLGDYRHSIQNGSGPDRILAESEKRIRQLISFEAIAMYRIDEDSADFQLSTCRPSRMKQPMEEEVEHMIDKGFFAWAVREQRGLFTPSKNGDKRLVLHVIATSSRIRGMFVGILSADEQEIPDGAITLLSVILLNTANTLESYEFYQFMHNQNEILREKIEERTRELAQTEQQLQQIDKIQAIGTLAGGIAHDFNNILFPIIGYTEMTLMDAPENSLIRNNLQEVLNATNRAKDLVKQILAFSRQSIQEFQPLRLQPIIKESLRLLRATIPSNITIVEDIAESCGPAMGDPTQIQQVIMNLCTNAYHAMQDTGGTLKVKLKEAEIIPDDVLQKMGIVTGKYLQLEIKDNGHGMQASVLRRIFEPYFTTKEQSKGTGLGLSVTHGILKSHGGDIQVVSEPKKGTTFQVYLPLIQNVDHEEKADSTEEDFQGIGHILLIDDEEPIVKVEKLMLKRLGYQVTALTSATEALNTFRSQPDQFDLVITDMTMPSMTGIELAPKLIDIRPGIPIILCSGFNEMVSDEKAKAIGIKAYVQKPLDLKVLGQTVRNVLENRSAESAPSVNG